MRTPNFRLVFEACLLVLAGHAGCVGDLALDDDDPARPPSLSDRGAEDEVQADMRPRAPDLASPPANTAPVARLDQEEDFAVDAPASIQLDASESFDPDGDALSFAWSIDDEPSEASGALFQHRWEEPGEHVVRLIVSDGRQSDERSVTISVREPTPKVTLPLEIYGEAEASVSAKFWVPEGASEATLHLTAHRLAYRDASTHPERGAKGSVRLHDGRWIDLYNGNEDLECEAHEAAYGCLNGAYHTVRFSVLVGELPRGENLLEFRMNQTDGFSNGWRVLALDLKDERGESLVAPGTFVHEDPSTWQPPRPAAHDIEEGRRLWSEARLVESPLSTSQLEATCADCHAVDGRDLKYFNYSNATIIARSRFHGFDPLQSEQVASYIRSLDVPYVEGARPWNPPYQPGPGLDDKPVHEWAAGAGLEWVLERDEEMIPYLVGEQELTAESIRQALDPDKTTNIRQMPIAMQLPDWNAWLPEVHPKDRLGEAFEQTEVFHKESLHQTYARVRQELKTRSREELIQSEELAELMGQLARQTTNLSSLHDGALGQEDKKSKQLSMVHWGAVKSWELMHEFELEGVATQVYGAEFGEARSWLSVRRNVFELAPHRVAENMNHFTHHSMLVGKYLSTAWYQLQLTLNAGNRQGITLWPVDWNYQPAHIRGLAGSGGPGHPLRYLASHAKMYQQFDDHQMMGQSALGFRQLQIYHFVPGQSQGLLIDMLPEPQRLAAFAALLHATMDVLERHPVSSWQRGDGSEGNNVLEPADQIVEVISRQGLNGHCHKGHRADCWYSALILFKEAGVSSEARARALDWGAQVWPMNDWEALR